MTYQLADVTRPLNSILDRTVHALGQGKGHLRSERLGPSASATIFLRRSERHAGSVGTLHREEGKVED